MKKKKNRRRSSQERKRKKMEKEKRKKSQQQEWKKEKTTKRSSRKIRKRRKKRWQGNIFPTKNVSFFKTCPMPFDSNKKIDPRFFGFPKCPDSLPVTPIFFQKEIGRRAFEKNCGLSGMQHPVQKSNYYYDEANFPITSENSRYKNQIFSSSKI